MHIKRNIFYVKLFYPSFLHLFSKIQCWTKKYVKSLPLFVACYLRDMRIFNESVRRCFCVTKKGKRLMITCYWDEMIQIEPVSPRIECQGPGLVSSLPHGAQREVRNLGEESRVGISWLQWLWSDLPSYCTDWAIITHLQHWEQGETISHS